MPKDLYDADGNAVAGAFLPEEVKAIEDEKAKVLKDADDLKARLTKLENKDYNFKRLRDMTEEEKQKLSVQELDMVKERERIDEKTKKLEDEQKSFFQRVNESHKNDALNIFVGDDDELRAKVEANLKRLNDPDSTKEEIYRKVKDAYNLSVAENKKSNPIGASFGFQGSPPSGSRREVASDELKSLGSKLGLSADELKKL